MIHFEILDSKVCPLTSPWAEKSFHFLWSIGIKSSESCEIRALHLAIPQRSESYIFHLFLFGTPRFNALIPRNIGCPLSVKLSHMTSAVEFHCQV